MALQHKRAQCTQPCILHKYGPEGKVGTSSTAPDGPYWCQRSQSVLPPKAQPLKAFLIFDLIELSQIHEVGIMNMMLQRKKLKLRCGTRQNLMELFLKQNSLAQ